MDAYNRAQGRFYASRLASDADFNQPGSDPAPALTLTSKKTRKIYGSADVAVGAAWERTNDNGEDDLPLADVLMDRDVSCERFVMKTLNPKTISAQPDDTQQIQAGELG